MDHENFMQMAIGKAERGDAPFGAIMVQNGKVIATAYNTVRSTGDPTAHAEMNLIRAATKELGTTNLEECTLYSSVEPCPMCMAAAMWAKVRRVVYGASLEELSNLWPVINLSCREVAARGTGKMEVIGGILSDASLLPVREKRKKDSAS